MSNQDKITPLKRNFISFCIENGVLLFGDFKTKAGRQSPHFLNFGEFCTGQSIDQLGLYYAQSILLIKETYDVIFGPAYKGIPLSITTVISLNKLGVNVSFCYDRKEVKDHGEGSMIIGSSLKGKKVIIIDDVLSSGLSIHNAKKIIEAQGGTLSAAIVAVDREEKSYSSNMLARDELAKEGISFYSIICISDIIQHIREVPELEIYADRILEYKRKYGTTDQ